jgi:UDP-N-acetyl-D-glucosamine dehydrogenase
MKVGVIGQGYVGSALGQAASKVGHEVIGIEIDASRIAELAQSMTYEITADYSQLDGCQIIVIAVPTPLDSKREPDLDNLISSCKSLSESLSIPTLIINESTSFPGTLRKVIAPIIGDNHLYAISPERVDPANPEWGIENTPRLISGLSREATEKAIEFYRSFCEVVIEVSSPEVAEAAKLFENTFRQINIALVNEFAQIAHGLGISAIEILTAAKSKPFGFMSFIPSLGVGGHCIPIDPSYLSFAASQVGVSARFINLANEVNTNMPMFVIERIKSIFGEDLSDKVFQVSGISYKAGVSDLRESPALTLMSLLRSAGAEVSFHDEIVARWNNQVSEPLKAVDMGIIATHHPGVDYSPWKNGNTKVIDLSTSPDTGWPKFL